MLPLLNLVCLSLLAAQIPQTPQDMTGFEAPDREGIRRRVVEFMDRHQVPGLAIAMAKEGKLVLSLGFGYADQSKLEPVSPQHVFRIASVSKPITAVALMTLVEAGKLDLEHPIFGDDGLLGLPESAEENVAYLQQLTVDHLLTHTAGGWDNGSEDPMFANPLMRRDKLIPWTLRHHPLQHVPGSTYAYSNFGYCLLGRVIEQVTAQRYADYVRKSVLEPCGISDMHIGADSLARKHPLEVVYYQPGEWNPYSLKVSRMDAHGGWVASAEELVKFAVRVDGFETKADILNAATVASMTQASPRNANYAKGWQVNGNHNWWHLGSMPGSASVLVRTHHGYCWAILTNTRGSGDFFKDLDRLPWEIVAGVQRWPDHDLFQADPF